MKIARCCVLAQNSKSVLPWARSQRDLVEPYPVEITEDWFKNGFGSIRWWRIRSAYYDNIINEDQVTDLYCKWRDASEYFMVNGLNSSSEVVISVFVKACKRGNDLYLSNMNKKFGFIDSLPPIHFFTDDQEHKTTPMLFVTLTADAKKYSLREAWDNISSEFNRFETLLRQKYGRFVKFRIWEAHKSGYPHCHVVYYFLDHAFNVFEYFNKKDTRCFIAADKHRKAISNMWSMGNIDVKGVQDTLGAFSEVKKYITKHVWNTKGDKTNAMCTLFRKQSYYVSQLNYRKKAMSLFRAGGTVDEVTAYISANIDKWAKRDFIGAVWGVGTYMNVYKALDDGVAEPRQNALVKQTMCNYNISLPEIVKWEFVGFVLGCDLAPFVKDFADDWVVSLKSVPIGLICLVNIRGDY